MNFTDKVAIITGSTSGIGEATLLQMARGGARVVMNYASNQEAAHAAEARARDAGADLICVQGNVAKDEDCKKLVQVALDKWGRLDIVVNNAGTTKFAAHDDLDALQAEDFQNIYGVNVVGPFQMIRAALEPMKAQGAGSVVNVSSIAGVAGIGSSVAYAASKGALNTMTLSLARALGPEVRINAVCPGFVGTPWFRDRFGQETFDTIVKRMEDTTPLKKAGTPESVAEAICFFASDASGFVTGETLLIDAGSHLDMTSLSQR